MGSAVLHVAVVGLFWLAGYLEPEPMVFETIAIELVSPPPRIEAPEPTPPTAPEELVIETPEEAAPPPDALPEPEVEKPPPEPEPEVEDPAPPEPEDPPDEVEEPKGPEPDPTSTGGEDIEVRMEGLRRDFPEYYQNIQRQINRCFRPPSGARVETVVYFVIHADGTVSDHRLVTQSGNLDLDYGALAAVECAGPKFGELPREYPWDRLPIQFSFRPSGERPTT